LKGRLTVQYFRSDMDVAFEPHVHPEYTVVICLQGAVSLDQLGQSVMIGPGEALIVNGEFEHSGSWHRLGAAVNEIVCVSVRPDCLSRLLAGFDLPAGEGATVPTFSGTVALPVLRESVLELIGEMTGERPGRGVLLENLATRLVIHILRDWPREAIRPVKTASAPRLSRREFYLAHDFMRSCRKEDFRLQRLCRLLGTSEERFSRLFVNTTGRTPANFYNRLLLDRAQDLLRNHKLSVKEIGYELGFKTSSHFNTAFRRELGVSPLEYRRQAPPVSRLQSGETGIPKPTFPDADAGNRKRHSLVPSFRVMA